MKEYYNIEIETAADGLIAVEMYMKRLNKNCKCSLRTYRLIIMDIGMPNMDGKEASDLITRALRRLMALGEEELTHIVALTSFSNAKLKEECALVGIKKVYNKPLNLVMLNEIMKNHYMRQ